MRLVREVPNHAVPVTKSDLVEGEVYFSLTFLDETLTVPCLEPVVYVGSDLEPGDSGQVYFQDYESYSSGARYERSVSGVHATFSSGDESEVSHLFQLEHAVDVLLNCVFGHRAPRS